MIWTCRKVLRIIEFHYKLPPHIFRAPSLAVLNQNFNAAKMSFSSMLRRRSSRLSYGATTMVVMMMYCSRKLTVARNNLPLVFVDGIFKLLSRQMIFMSLFSVFGYEFASSKWKIVVGIKVANWIFDYISNTLFIFSACVCVKSLKVCVDCRQSE